MSGSRPSAGKSDWWMTTAGQHFTAEREAISRGPDCSCAQLVRADDIFAAPTVDWTELTARRPELAAIRPADRRAHGNPRQIRRLHRPPGPQIERFAKMETKLIPAAIDYAAGRRPAQRSPPETNDSSPPAVSARPSASAASRRRM